MRSSHPWVRAAWAKSTASLRRALWATVPCAIDDRHRRPLTKDHDNPRKSESLPSLVQRMENVLQTAKAQAMRAQEMKKTAQEMQHRAAVMVAECHPFLP